MDPYFQCFSSDSSDAASHRRDADPIAPLPDVASDRAVDAYCSVGGVFPGLFILLDPSRSPSHMRKDQRFVFLLCVKSDWWCLLQGLL
jgi:hypothetical protein